MLERSSKNKRVDLNVLAKSIVGKTIEDEEARPLEQKPDKNSAAVELGRLGGLKGGKARAAKLSIKRRREIAKKAAEVRWQNKKHSKGAQYGEAT